MSSVSCPICLNIEQNSNCVANPAPNGDSCRFDCSTCGEFEISNSLLKSNELDNSINNFKRAVLSHYLCTNSSENKSILLTSNLLDGVLSNKLPNPARRVTNIVRYLGKEISRTGEPVPTMTGKLRAYIGSPSMNSTKDLIRELMDKDIVRVNPNSINSSSGFRLLDLTLKGWEMYEEEKRGAAAGNYGFIAMKFGDDELEQLVAKVIKPTIENEIGYEIVDLRDVAQAGLIDNIMREKIRNSAFVLVDLTHDNSGAYWEAGYAEGLGKPVIYLCKESKFNEHSTHFDTNHCTTVLWSKTEPEKFELELVATLRRSLL